MPSQKYLDFSLNALSRSECQYPFCFPFSFPSPQAKNHVTLQATEYRKQFISFSLIRIFR